MWKLKVWVPSPRGWKLIADRTYKSQELCMKRRLEFKRKRICLAYYGRVA